METLYNVELNNGDRVTEGTLSLFLVENKNLVFFVWKKYFNNFIKEKEDLMQIGWIALWQAVKKYDGVSSTFGYYATASIKNQMLRYVLRQQKFGNDIQLADDEILRNANEEDIEENLLIEMALEDTNIAKRIMNGERVVDIAKEENLTRAGIYKRLDKEKAKILEKIR